MTRLMVEPGACGMRTEVRAERLGDGSVAVDLRTDCLLVTEWAGRLGRLDPLALVGRREPGAAALPCDRCHAGCLVPVGVIKAVEVEAGLNLPVDASIRFLTDD